MNHAARIFCLLCLAIAAHSEDLYVTSSGSGASDGSNWSNAFAGFGDVAWGSGAGQLGAGDTLWVAGGSYSTYLTLAGSGSAGNPIYIKRARSTNSECTSATGWSSGYDATVEISAAYGFSIDNSSLIGGGGGRYCVVDGQITNGFKVNLTDVSGSRGIDIGGYGSFNSIFRFIEVAGPSTAPGYGFVNDVRGFHVSTYDGRANTDRPANLTFEYMTIHGLCAGAYYVHVSNLTNQLNEYHTIETEGSEVHQNLVYIMSSDNLVFRFNHVHSMGGSVGLFHTDFGSADSVQTTNHWIYGNVFRDSDYGSSRFIDVRDSATGTGPLYIYNNTFVSGYGAISIGAALNPNAESYIRNNLLVDFSSYYISVPGGSDYVTASDNIETSSYAMFVTPGSTNVLSSPYGWQFVRDLHLVQGSSPINAGSDLGSSFNRDFDANTRGADGTWDVGVFEYQNTVAPNTPRVHSGFRGLRGF